MNNDGYESVEGPQQTAAPTQSATTGAAAQRIERPDELVTDISSGSGSGIEDLQQTSAASSSFVPAAASGMADLDGVRQAPYSLELSRVTPSQRLATEEFMESPRSERWDQLVHSMRRRNQPSAMSGAAVQSTEGRDESKSDCGSLEVPHSSLVPPAATASSQHCASIVGIENAPFDDNDTPVSAAQISESYKRMEDAIKSIENAEELTPPPSPNGGHYYGDIEDQKNTKMGLELGEENKRPADPEPCLGSTSDVQQPSIDVTVLPAGNALATANQEDPHGSPLEVQTPVPADHASAAVNQGAHLTRDLQQPFTVAPAASSTQSGLTDDAQVGHDQDQITVATPRPPPRSMLAATPNDQDQITAADPTFRELEATLIDAEVHYATRLSDSYFEQSPDNDPTPSGSRRLNYMFVGLIMIIGVMAGIVATLLLPKSNDDDNVNESYSGIQGEATPSPSSSFVPSSIPSKNPSASPSGGPSRAPSSLPSQIPSILPSVVQSSDIGDVGVPGSASEISDGSWVVKGSGNDIWDRSDQFHYVHFAKTGSVVLELLVESFYTIHSWQKGGLMFRESLDANSKHYSLYVTGNQGIANQWRGSTGGTSSSLDNSGLNTKPVWIQVSKSANEFSTAYKYEGATEWTPLWGPTHIGFSSDFYVGIVAHSHINGRLATLKAREFNIIDMPTPEPQECLMVTTGTPSEFSVGPVDIFVDSGSGYVTVSTPGKHHGKGEIVIDQCFHTIVGVQVSNQSVIGWAGVFELSTDGKVTYFPLICSDCTGTTNTMPISVDGDATFFNDQLTTWCFDGATCTLSAHPQSSALELIPNEEIVSHSSYQNVAIDRDTAIVGAPQNDNGKGSVFVNLKDENGEWSQQSKLVASDGASYDYFGSSVAIYGNTAIVGAWGSDSAYVFVRNGVTWSRQWKLTGGGGFGYSVAIYGDTVIVGANKWSGPSVQFFVRNGVTWSYQANFLSPDGAADDSFGMCVAIYGDTAIVGASDSDDEKGANSGSAHIFVRNGVTWSHQTKLVHPYGASHDRFGSSVAIYDNSAIVGAWADDDNGSSSGSAHVFIQNGVTWPHQAKLLAPDGAYGDLFGVSVAIYGDTAIVGAERDDDNRVDSGSAHVYVRNGFTWKSHAKLLAPISGEMFGRSVGIYDGTIIVGSGSGEAHVFSAFSPPTEALFETDCDPSCYPRVAIYGDTAVVTRRYIDVQFFSTTNSMFELITKIDIDYNPTAAAINDNTAVIGSSTENGHIGAVYVYEKDQLGIWYQVIRIVISRGAGPGWASITEGTLFGRDVAIYGGVMIVGADDDGAEGQGSVYIYRRNGTTWIEEANLTPPNYSTAEGFGYSVSVKGNTVAVGDLAYGDNQEGAVFVYEYESLSNSWIQSGSTLMNNGCSWFGSFVILTHDEELLVSCLGSDRVYYYEKQEIGNEYVLQQIIGFDNDVDSIAVDGNAMVVSEDRDGRPNVIRFFERKNHVWEEVNIIDEPTFDEYFGQRVALFGNTALITSHTNVYPLEDYFSS